MRFHATTDRAGRHSCVIIRIEGHAPLILNPDQALELATAITNAAKQAATERQAGPAPLPEPKPLRRKAS